MSRFEDTKHRMPMAPQPHIINYNKKERDIGHVLSNPESNSDDLR